MIGGFFSNAVSSGPKMVLPIDKSSDNGLLFYCLIFLDSEYAFMELDLTPQSLKSDENSWRYTNLKIKFHFHERQNLGNFG